MQVVSVTALQVTFISPQEAVFAQQRGVPIIDVRPALDYSCSRIPGSIGIPFMRSITGKCMVAAHACQQDRYRLLACLWNTLPCAKATLTGSMCLMVVRIQEYAYKKGCSKQQQLHK